MSDGCVAEKSIRDNYSDMIFHCALALVEVKTDWSLMRFPEMLLQLPCFSKKSIYKQGTVLLGTDGNRKWCLLKFGKPNHIYVTPYRYGRQCLVDFGKLLKSVTTRRDSYESLLENRKRQRVENNLQPIEEAKKEAGGDQDLDGFDLHATSDSDQVRGGQEAVDKAIEDAAFFDRFANALAEDPRFDGSRPTVPEWALARNEVPS
jgi:hypothetical protein